jgi:photosystem II stability/assembly factor-like uncharacterized protein
MLSKSCLIGFLVFLPGAAPQGLSADEVVSRNVQARGGLHNLHALRSLRLTGKIRQAGRWGGGREDDWAQLQKRPAQLRQEVSRQGLTEVVAFDGREGWSFRPFQGRREPERSTADNAKELAQNADLEGPLVDWREKGHQVEYLGTEEVDGTQAHKLRVTLKDGDVKYIFLDEDSFLEIRVVSQRRVRGVELVTETDLGNYEEVQGVWLPFSVESGRKGGPRAAHITVERAEVNVDAEDSLFRFPAAGTKVVRAIFPGPKGAETPASKPPATAAKARPPVFDSGVISGLGARNIGSATMSGRISAIAGRIDGGNVTLYVAAASGGVWKSTDNGTTFKAVFDKQPVQSIGSVAIDPSNPKTVWVGTGETWTRNSVSVGDGIYKSTDAGETWSRMGLGQSERIDRIIVHPKNSSVVYACVPGKLWSDSSDRGVYKTTDGGNRWALVLNGSNLSTGCSGLTMDSKNPEVLLAGMWDFRRKGWTFRSGGEGPDTPSGSGLFRSSDGGKTWSDLSATSKGLPAKPWGRVEVAFAPTDPKIAYTLIESKDSALYRSSDGGDSWEPRDKSRNMVWRPFYFGRLVVDPSNADRLFKPDYDLIVSEDGGRSFANLGTRAHVDWHDVWIDPTNTKHVVAGNDGGLWMSFDGGSRWWKFENLPVSQFYHVSVDAKDPYRVYGGLQDNSSWVGDSQYPRGISNARWENLYGGDGFWMMVDPSDPEAVYVESQGGHLGRVDRKLPATRDIQPTAGYREKLRFNWNTPIHLSPTEKGTVYVGAQFLFRSRDHGDSWERVSPDLTTNDPQKQRQEEAGGVTVDNSSAEMHTTIYSISESPTDSKVIWIGTDDGNVQLTRDGGKSWTNLVNNVPGLPPASWVSWVEASRFAPATAYAAFDRHTFGDITPWVYRTTDFGKSWTRIVGPNQGVRGYAHVIKEDLVKSSLLFCGTEFGLWISIDGGQKWAEFKGGDFPSAAVRDLQVHPREQDLVIATHGRGIWIVDDLSPLRALSSEMMSKPVAFLPNRPAQQRMSAPGGWADGDASFVGENPPGGAVINYYQRARHVYGPIRLEILDSAGKLVDTLPAAKRRGVNRALWSMQVRPPRVPPAAQVAEGSTRGPHVLPGTYTVRLVSGPSSVETKLEVQLDRRAPYNVAERKEQFDAAMRVHALFGEMSTLMDRVELARNAAEARARALSLDDGLGKKLRAVAESLSNVRKEVVATKEGGAITGEERLREHADHLYGSLLRWEGRPARYQIERIDALKRELDDVKGHFDGVVTAQVRPLDEELRARKLDPIPTELARAPAASSALTPPSSEKAANR